MKKLALIFLIFVCPQIIFANASDDEGFHDCRLAAKEVAQSFFDKAAGILALRSSRLYFSNKTSDAYLFYGSMSNGYKFELVAKIADEESCLPASVELRPDAF